MSLCLSKRVYEISVTVQHGMCETEENPIISWDVSSVHCSGSCFGLTGIVKLKHLQTCTMDVLWAAESAHLFSIQDVQSQRGHDAARD